MNARFTIQRWDPTGHEWLETHAQTSSLDTAKTVFAFIIERFPKDVILCFAGHRIIKRSDLPKEPWPGDDADA